MWFLRLYSIVTLAVLTLGLVLALATHYAILPAILNSELSDATLRFRSVAIYSENMTNTHFRTSASGSLEGISGTATVASMSLSVMTANGTELGTMTVPTMTASDGASFDMQTVFRIVNRAALVEAMRGLLNATTASWILYAAEGATVTPYLGTLPLLTYDGVPFKKAVDFRGFSGLAGLNVTRLDMTKSTNTSLVLEATVVMPNPSVFSAITLGGQSIIRS